MFFVMYVWLLAFSFGGDIGGNITHIARANQLTREAEYAYKMRNYSLAASKYTLLVDSLKAGGENALLNLAHSHYNLPDTATAALYYNRLLNVSKNNAARSVALQQLGVMAAQRKDWRNASNYFQNAIKADPRNDVARHNYIKAKQEERKQNKEPQQPDQNKKDKEQQQNQPNNSPKDKNQQQQGGDGEQEKQDDSQGGQKKDDKQKQQKSGNKDSKNQNQNKDGGDKDGKDSKEGKDKDGKSDKEDLNADGSKNSPKNGQSAADATKNENSKGKPDVSKAGKESDEEVAADPEQLKKMNLTQEKAKMLLEAMRNSEVQYLQQRKHGKSSKSNKDKPDW